MYSNIETFRGSMPESLFGIPMYFYFMLKNYRSNIYNISNTYRSNLYNRFIKQSVPRFIVNKVIKHKITTLTQLLNVRLLREN